MGGFNNNCGGGGGNCGGGDNGENGSSNSIEDIKIISCINNSTKEVDVSMVEQK